MAPPDSNILRGVLERIRFFNEENHFCIGDLKPEGKGKPVTIKGRLPGVQCGETLQLEGKWIQHPVHGRQFAFQNFRSTLPATVHGIRKYLGSGLVPGIGSHFAGKIVDHFGAETLRILTEESARLKEVPGIGAKRAREVKAAWDEQRAVREVLMFLQTYGVSVNQCLRLVKQYGAAARDTLTSNPFQAARDIHGIGFKTADKIALNLGFANDSPERTDGGLLFAMEEAEDEGHTGLPPEELLERAAALLQTTPAKIRHRLRRLIENTDLAREEGGVLLQLPGTLKRERQIARSIQRLLAFPSGLPPIKVEPAIQWAQKREGLAFATEQAEALRVCLKHKMAVITGGPGTGKTSILRALVRILKAKKVNVRLASPTGRAAQRMTETTGLSAQTIHRLLRFDPGKARFTVNEDHPLDCDCLIVDETSMLDTWLAAALFRAMPSPAHLILVGDANQLPSVAAGNVLKDLIQSGLLPVAGLSRIFRQDERGGIVALAHQILEGHPAPPPPLNRLSEITADRDVFFVSRPRPEDCLETVIELCRGIIPRHFGADPVMDIQVIAPMHKGLAGIENLNRELQNTLNKQAAGIPSGGAVFYKGDKVIQTRNNYELGIFNGDMGRVTRVQTSEGNLAAEFNGETLCLGRADLADLRLAYAVTVHKSQGSEFPVVVAPLLKQHYPMLRRNLLYTAVTRARGKVFLVGDPAAYSIAARKKEGTERWTDLERKLRAGWSAPGAVQVIHRRNSFPPPFTREKGGAKLHKKPCETER